MRDQEYLFITAMLKARRSGVLDTERVERLLTADATGATRMLAEYGFGELEGLDSAGVDKAMSALRASVFDELEALAPEKAAVRFFRLQYDCHNAKALVKSSVSGVDVSRLLSDCGSIKKETLVEALRAEEPRGIPEALAHAVAESRARLTRTGNPQLAELALDSWHYAALRDTAKELDNKFAVGYAKLLTDSANLRGAVRVLRLGGDRELFALSQLPGGSVTIKAPTAEAISEAFSGGPLSTAAEVGADAVKGGDLTAVETLCDRAVAAYVAESRMISFGVECLMAFLAGFQVDLATVRMIMSMKLVGMEPARIRERLVSRL